MTVTLWLCICSWHPNFLLTSKTKLQRTQNSCIRFCFGLKDRSHMEKNEFKKINWPPVSNRFDQCLAVTAYNFKNALCPKHMGDIYSLGIFPNIRTRRSTYSFVVTFYKKRICYKISSSISYLGYKIWNNVNQYIKASPYCKQF